MLALSMALALLAGCGTAEKKAKPEVAPPSLIQAPGQATLTVSADNAGAGIVLERTQALVVRLPLVFTTGLEWSLVDMKPGVLASQGQKFERLPRNVDLNEVGGTSVWRLVPEAAGSVALNFQLRRPHSLVPATQTVTYNVTVK